MSGINFPRITATITPAPASLTTAHNVLFIGIAGTGSYVAGDLYLDQPNDASLASFVGASSPLGKALTIHRLLNPSQKVSFVPLAEASGGTQATGSIVVSGSATQSGSVKFKVGGHDDDFIINVTVGESSTSVAAKLRTAINSLDNGQVTAAGSGSTVSLTAKQKGLHGNHITVMQYKTPLNTTGLSFALTAFTGGAGVPTYPTITAIADDYVFDTLCLVDPDESQWREYSNQMDARFNVNGKIKSGIVICALPTTAANTDAITTNLKTNKSTVGIAVKTVDKPDQKGLPLKIHVGEYAALLTAFRQLKFTEGSALANFVQDGGARDIEGGTHQSAKPYTNTILRGFELAEVGTDYTEEERNLIQTNGMCSIGNHRSGQYITFSEMVTPYRQNTQGVADNSFTYLEVVDTLLAARRYTYDVIATTYSQSALAVDSSVVGFKIATTGKIEGTMMEIFSTLSGEDYILYDEAGISIYSSNLVVTLNKREGRVSITTVMPIITQLRRVDIVMALTFDV